MRKVIITLHVAWVSSYISYSYYIFPSMCIRIKWVRSKVRLSGNARIASVHGPPYLLQRLVWPITVWVFLVSGATAINDGITEEPRRSWRCHCGLCRTSTAVAPRLRCDGGSTVEARRNMLKVSAVPPRRSAVLTVFGGATAINDRTTAELRRSWRCHCGLCRTSTAVAPRIRCDGGITHLTFGSHYIYFPHTHFLFKSRMWHHVFCYVYGCYHILKTHFTMQSLISESQVQILCWPSRGVGELRHVFLDLSMASLFLNVLRRSIQSITASFYERFIFKRNQIK